MAYILRVPQDAANRSIERSRAMERQLEVVSRAIWPWHYAWLVPMVALLAALDLLSTYAFLELSGKARRLREWSAGGLSASARGFQRPLRNKRGCRGISVSGRRGGSQLLYEARPPDFCPGPPTWPFSSLTRW